MPLPSPTATAAALAALVLAGCSAQDVPAADAPAGDAPAAAPAVEEHGHDHAGGHASQPVGDGTASYEVGYTLRDVSLPRRAGEPGRLSFVVDYLDRPQTDYLVEQTKQMHVYVVREDLAVFRHVHPAQQEDGSWSARLTLPEPGDYRVVTEFVAEDDGGNGDHVLLGAEAAVPGRWRAEPVAEPAAVASDWGVEATVLDELVSGAAQGLRIRLAAPGGGAPRLGTYLGTSAHLTGFHVDTGAVVHMHPDGEPEDAGGATDLLFHAELPAPGDYVLFLQVPVEGFLHTLPIRVTAS